MLFAQSLIPVQENVLAQRILHAETLLLHATVNIVQPTHCTKVNTIILYQKLTYKNIIFDWYNPCKDYFLDTQCTAGTEIKNDIECKMACELLGIPLWGKVFKKNRPCYKAGAGMCKQNLRKPGGKAIKVCKGIKTWIQVLLTTKSYFCRISVSISQISSFIFNLYFLFVVCFIKSKVCVLLISWMASTK